MENIKTLKLKEVRIQEKHFFGKHPDALKLVEHMTDEEIEELNRGGHDPIKVFNAYKKAYECKDKPTVIWHSQLRVWNWFKASRQYYASS